jgi:hypothetical protein
MQKQQSRSSLNTPNKLSSSKAACKVTKKRPASAGKSTTAQKHREKVLNQIYGGVGDFRLEGKSSNYEDSASPSKLNKSVTFNNQVRVREYGDAATAAGTSHSYKPSAVPKDFSTPNKQSL